MTESKGSLTLMKKIEHEFKFALKVKKIYYIKKKIKVVKKQLKHKVISEIP